MQIQWQSKLRRAGWMGALAIGIIAIAPATGARAADAAAASDDTDLVLDLDALGIAESGLSPELLLFQDIPTVALAAKHAQPVTLAPSSVSVITAEDIRRQGARTITDLIRNVPGMDVLRITNSDVNVGGRGLNGPRNDNLLVLVDGRSVYVDYFGVVFWDSLPVVMEDIERIEIIRGPGSFLHGANAYSGIINIITKDPEQHATNTVSGTLGTQDRYVTTYIHAGTQDKWQYKAIVSWNEINEFDDRSNGFTDDDNAREILRVTTSHIYTFADDETVRLNTGVTDADGGVLTGLGTFHYENVNPYVQGIVNYGEWEAQLWYSHLNTHTTNTLLDPFSRGGGTGPQGRAAIVSNVFNADFHHRLDVLETHAVTWGAGYRYNQTRARNIIGKNQHFDLFHAFAQDEWQPTDDVTITGGFRVDHRQLTGLSFTPRLSAVYAWRPEHIFRASFSRAFRDPTIIESFLSINGAFTFSGFPNVPFTATGNRNLDPEEITSYELGYNGRLLDGDLRVGANVFYSDLDEIIEFFGAPTLTYFNVGGAEQFGVELEAEYQLKPWLRPYVNYSFIDFQSEANNAFATNDGQRIKSAPQNKVNAGVYADWESGWAAMAQMHWVDHTRHSVINPAPVTPLDLNLVRDVDSYTRVDTRVAYHIEDPDLELSIAVYNLFNDRHQEYPFGERFARSVVLNALWKF